MKASLFLLFGVVLLTGIIFKVYEFPLFDCLILISKTQYHVPTGCTFSGRQDVVEGQAISGGMTIGDATEFCERAVPAHCVSTTCPLFCNTLRSRRQRTLCNSGCTPSGRCLLRPVAAGDDPTNRILDAQNRDQLFACKTHLFCSSAQVIISII